MAVSIAITTGFKDPNYFDNLNPQSAYMYSGGGQTQVIPAHNQLTGLQGGATGEYYHFNTAEHQELSAWLSQMSYNSAADQVENITLYGEIYLNNNVGVSHESRYIYWGDTGDVDTYIHEFTDDVLRLVCGDGLVMTWDVTDVLVSVDLNVAGEITVDTINEYSADTGVTVDSLLIKDQNIGTSSLYQGVAYLTGWELRDEATDINNFVRLYSNTAGDTWQQYVYRFGGTIASPAATPTDASLREVLGYAYDGGASRPITRHVTKIDGAVASDNVAGKYQWYVRPSGAGVSLTLEMSLGGAGLTLSSGATVDTIEVDLTEDDTHIPTSGAVYDAIAVGVGGKLDTSDRTIYIETTGDDVTGDGSIGDPFATILRALQDIGSILDPAIITFNFGIGTFQYDADCIVEFGRLKFFGPRARLYFQGTTNTVESGLTLTEQAGKEWRYDVSGATFTSDEHNENFLIITDSVSSAMFPIMGNGTTTIDSFTGVEDATEIVTLQTIIEFTALIFSPDVVGGRFRIKNIDCDATIGSISYRVDNMHAVFRESILRIDSITSGYLYEGPGLLFNNSLILTDNETGYGVKNYGLITLNKAGLRHDGSGSGNIAYGVSDMLETGSHSLFIQNYAWGIEARKASKFTANDLEGGKGCIIFNDVTYAFGCSNNSIIHVGSESNASPAWMRTYIENVDYVLYSREGVPYHGINVHIDPLYGTPNTAYLHSIFDDFLDGMPSFNHNIVIDGYNLYESTYNTTETSPRTIYVATAGDDVTGDGTGGTPYATLLRALQDVRNIIDAVTITISLGIGTFTYNGTEIQHELLKKEILGAGTLLIEGTPVLKDSGFTLAASGDPYIYNVSGTSFSVNEHQDRFLLVGGNYYGIMSNGTTTINTQIGLAAGVSIYGMDTVLECTDGVFDVSVKNINAVAQIHFKQLTIDASFYTWEPATGNIDLKFFDCLIEATDIVIDQQVLKVLFSCIHIVVSSDGIDDNSRIPNAIGYKNLTLRKSGATAGTGINAPANMLFQTTYIANFEYGVALRAGLVIGNQVGTNLIFEDCTYAINVLNRSQLVCTLLAVYIENVDYTFSGDGETIAFGTKVYIEDFTGTPNTATFDASVDEAVTDSSIDVYWLPFEPEPGNGGGVSISGTPVAAQVVIWNDASTIEGDAGLTYNTGTNTLTLAGTLNVNTSSIQIWEDGSSNLTFKDAVTGTKTLAQLAAGGGGVSFGSGDTDNYLLTSTGVGDQIQGETNLTFDGTTLQITGDLTVTAPSNTITEERVLFWNSTTGVVSYGPDGGGSTTNYMRGDGTWAAPGGGGSPGGSDTYIQFNDASAFGGSVNFTWDDYTIRGTQTAAHAAWNDFPNSLPSVYTFYAVRGSSSYGINNYNGVLLNARGSSGNNAFVYLGVEALSVSNHTSRFNLLLRGSASTDYETVFSADYNSTYYWKAGSDGTDITHLFIQDSGTPDTRAVMGWDDSALGFQIETGTGFSATPAIYIGYTNNHVCIGGQTDSAAYELYVTGEIYSTGDMYATDFNLTSDPRLKDVYGTFTDGLDTVMKLNPVTYRWKDHKDDYIHIGFLTTEVEKIRPELVKYDDQGYGRLSYAKITALNTAAIQDLNTKVETVEDRLRSRILELEDRVKELEDGRNKSLKKEI